MILKKISVVSVLALTLMLGGCKTWSYGSVNTYDKNLKVEKTEPRNIIVTVRDIDRPYIVLGDIKVTVNKTTLFNKAPTPEVVNESLKEKAATMGADAVIEVTYGEEAITLMSWGAVEGRGKAVKFK